MNQPKELKLKHLLSYAAYGLKVIWKDNLKYQWKVSNICCSVSGNVSFIRSTKTRVYHELNRPLSEIKPILRPLSDLFKQIEIEGKLIIPINELKNLYGWDYLWYDVFKNKKKFNMNELRWSCLNKMLEWHFDVYNLIPASLALSIHGVKNK